MPDRPGIAAAVFGAIGRAGINVDIIVQNVSHDGFTDLSFTIAEEDLPRSRPVLDDVARSVGAEQVVADTGIATVSVVGTAFLGTPGMFARIFAALCRPGHQRGADHHQPDPRHRDHRPRPGADAVRALHAEFELESD